MTERPITFPKTAEGVWINSETGVKIEKRHPATGGGYRAFRPADVSTGYLGLCQAVKTLAEARHVAKRYIADVARPEIARAYVEAVAMHIELAADVAVLAGAPTWRAESARRAVKRAQGTDSQGHRILAIAIDDVRRLEEGTAEYVRMKSERRGRSIAEASAEDAERLVAKDGADALVHYWTMGSNDFSACGVNIMTTPYTFGSPEWDEVTCKPCKDIRTKADLTARAKRAAARLSAELTANAAKLGAVLSEDEREIEEQAYAEDRARYGFGPGDVVVLTDPEGIGVDTDSVWRVEEVRGKGTLDAYALLVGHDFPQMTTASRFSRLAPAPRCTSRNWEDEHEFVADPAEQGGAPRENVCYRLRTSPVHNTDRVRAARTIHAARDHAGAATGTPYGGEWPGTTTVGPYGVADYRQPLTEFERRCGVVPIERPIPTSASAPADVRDDAAWSEYAASLPAPTPEAMAEVAVEMSTWTAQRRAAVEAFRSAARSLWSLRAEGLALPGSSEYARLRESMRCFREITEVCDRQNEALRRELLTAGSL